MIGLGQKKYALGLTALALLIQGLFAFPVSVNAAVVQPVSPLNWYSTINLAVTLPDSVTRFFSCGDYLGTVTNSWTQEDACTVLRSDTIDRADLCISTDATGFAGISEDLALYVRLNNTTDYTISTTAHVTGTANTSDCYTATGLGISVSPGDKIALKIVTPVITNNTARLTFNAQLYSADQTVATFPSNADGYLRNNGSGTLTWDNASTIKTFLSLNNVENTALSTWAGTSNLTTLGTITTGTWTATDITDTYLDLTAWTGSTAITTLGTITTGEWTGTIIDSAYLDISGSGSLPADAEGFLFNDGAGALSWTAASAGDTIVEDDMIDGIAILLYFGAFVVFAFVALYKNF